MAHPNAAASIGRSATRTRRRPARRLLTLVAAISLLPGILLEAAGPVTAAAVQPPVADPAAAAVDPVVANVTVPSGFVDEQIVDGLFNPTAVAFAPDGRVFVTEKRGKVLTWPSLAAFERDDAPATTIDIRSEVMNYWDRGLLGLAVDPGYPATPAIYLLYTRDALPGGNTPRWNIGDPSNDPCPVAPGGTTDGCVVTTALDRVTVNTTTGLSTGRTSLLLGWCQQFPSHSAGAIAFGADGMLYVSGGDGASFNTGSQDYGQYGGTKPDTTSPITPRNPCGDPPGGVGGALTAPTAEGGALRSQSFRRAADEDAVLNGTVLRLDPATGLAAAGNPAISNPDLIRRRIVAYGLRNPYRIVFRPGTNDLYIGDVGFSLNEEVDRMPDPTVGPRNFGWPCREGTQSNTYYTSVTLDLCSSLQAGQTTDPLYVYSHSGHMASADGCTSGGASISGLAFATSASYPSQYRNGLFVADYTRNCIVVLPAGGGGVPTSTAIPFAADAEGPVMLVTDPSGNIVYPAFSTGKIRRIRYQPPVAAFSATPSSGLPPLEVTFNGGGSSAPAGIVSYAWDFGDDSPAGSGAQVQHTYAEGTWTARLTITDGNGITATTTKTIAAANTPPVVTLDAPTCETACWKVGDVIQLAAHATDTQDGTVPDSAFEWHVGLMHCHGAGDCHEHDLVNASGVDSTSIVAPDHDSGSFLRVVVTVTDSGGLTDTASIEVHPRESTLRVVSSPGGVPVTLEGETGNGSVGPIPAIVGHAATIAATPSYVVGEDRYTFKSWSDGGALSHGVTAGETARTFTATYTHTTTDAANSCSSAPVVTPANKWSKARFGTGSDVDWIRFSVTKTQRVRLVLGNLPVDGQLELYRGCTTRLATVNHSGTYWEEIVSTLSAGTYAIKMTNRSGVAATADHQWIIQPLASGAAIVSSGLAPASSSSLRLVGEVINTTSKPRTVTVTARLYSSSGKLLKTITSATLIRTIGGYQRSPFAIATSKPAGYASARFTITSVSARTATRLLTVKDVTKSVPATGSWRIHGTIVNGGSTTATFVRAIPMIRDHSGQILNATSVYPSLQTLARGRSATFTATFGGLTITPMSTTARAKAS